MAITASPCYCRGTLILTEEGELPVEELGIGHRVVTFTGEARPIKWIWHRSYDGRLIIGNHALLPVRFADGALADAMPTGDLLISPEHHIYLDKSFVQASYLVNGATITQLETIEHLEYYHIELDKHDVIIAQGTPTETFVGNTQKFTNNIEYSVFYPNRSRRTFPRYARYPHRNAPQMTAIRVALMRRAQALGYRLDIDPDLHVIAGSGIIRPAAVSGRTYRFLIPDRNVELYLASRSTVPADVVPGDRDVRRLGVPIERIVLCDAVQSIEKQHGDPALHDGFHNDEASFRWTDGRGRLPSAWAQTFAGAFTLEVYLAPSGLPYLTADDDRSNG